MEIAIIGAGWYGCHLATSLKNFGFNVSVFEKKREIFTGASSKNQNRLHLGFHYARDASTRDQTKKGFEEFKKQYGFVLEDVYTNIYAVPEIESQICPETYRLTMVSSGLYFDQINPKRFGIDRCKFGFKTQEKIINWKKAKIYFENKLKDNLHLSSKIEKIENFNDTVIVNGKKFDFLVDCSWGQLNLFKNNIFFEPCILLRYKLLNETQNFALTLVDGSLPSFYPESGSKTFTLSSVSQTPLGKFSSWDRAVDVIEKTDIDTIDKKIDKMEAEIKFYYPSFSKHFEFIEPQMSIKTKTFHRSAQRKCTVKRQGRVIEIMSGKIDTIFSAQNEMFFLMSQNDYYKI